jgi:hypothetical protein
MQDSGSEPEEFYFLSLSGVSHPLELTVLLVMQFSNQLGSLLLPYLAALYSGSTERAKRQEKMDKLSGKLGIPSFQQRWLSWTLNDSTPLRLVNEKLDIEGLRAIQYIIDMGLRDLNDLTDIKAIDQFQTAAIRYQLYEHMYALGAYQGMTIVAIQPH